MVQWILATDGTLLRTDRVVRVNLTEYKPEQFEGLVHLEAFTDEMTVELTGVLNVEIAVRIQENLGCFLSGNGPLIIMREEVRNAKDSVLNPFRRQVQEDSEADDFERRQLNAMDEKGYI